MKKILLSLLALMSVTFVSAQELGGYTPAISNGTYTPLEGGTVVNAGIPASDLSGKVILSDAYSPDSWTAATGKAFSIGFDFPFNGKTFSYFAIGANGAIKLSETEDTKVMFASWNICFSTPDNGGENLIMAYDKSAKSYAADNTEGKDTTVISYKSTDEELVVEYKNLGINTSSWGTDLKGTYDLQIRLKKDGTIVYVYSGLADLAETSAGQVYLGVKGADDGNGNRDLLTWESLACKTKSWNSPSSFNLSAVADGYTITLNTPGETVAPTVQGELTAQITSQMNYDTNKAYPQAQASFTAVDGADKYLMLIKKGDATDVPEDGVTYETKGQCGDSYVMYAGTPYNFNIFSNALEPAAKYTVTLYAYNSFGKGGAKYNTVDAPSVTLTTPAGAPKSMKLTQTTKNSLEIAVESNDHNDLVFVAYNTKTWNPGNMGSRAYTGTPNADAKAGDALYTNIDEQSGMEEGGKNEEAGKVAYFGPTGSFTLSDLDPSKSYYFIAYSYDQESKTFDLEPDTLQLMASTNIVPPYQMDLTDAPATTAPGGWISNPAGNSTGFWAAITDDANVTHNGERAFQCQNEDWEHVYTLTSPVIELTNDSISFDWHIHQKSGWGFWATEAALDPEENWSATDYIKFVLYVDGEEVELKKIDSTNAPADESAYVWHSEAFDISKYAGKNAQFGVKWLCANNNNTYLGFDNLAITEIPEAKGAEFVSITPEAGSSVTLDTEFVATFSKPVKCTTYLSGIKAGEEEFDDGNGANVTFNDDKTEIHVTFDKSILGMYGVTDVASFAKMFGTDIKVMIYKVKDLETGDVLDGNDPEEDYQFTFSYTLGDGKSVMRFDPEDGTTVTSLKDILVSCKDGLVLAEDIDDKNILLSYNKESVETIAAADLKAQEGEYGAPGYYTISLSKEYTEAGTYELYIPAGVFTIAGQPNEVTIATWTIEGESTGLATDPAPGVVESLSKITLTYNNGDIIYPSQQLGADITVTDATGAVVATFDQDYLQTAVVWSEAENWWDEMPIAVTLTFDTPITAAGTYTVNVPFQAFYLGESYDNSPATTFVYTIEENVADGINGVNADNDAPVYNISGQRVKANAKGIVIKNGHKYLVK